LGAFIAVLGFLIAGYISGVLEKKSIEALSRAMVNRVVVVDPGHGGIDPGAKGAGGAVEKEITLAVARKLADFLHQSGATVILTRDSDTMLYDPDTSGLLAKKRQDLSRRVNMANENNADAFVSIHVNSFKADSRQHGAQTFSQPGSEESKELSKSIQAEIIRLLKNTTRKPKEVDYFTGRKSKMSSVIVEIGFVSNPEEEKLLLDPEYQTKMAFSIYAGIVKYFAASLE
jgi:N-acetylmuramoyl-L-alanine amidase